MLLAPRKLVTVVEYHENRFIRNAQNSYHNEILITFLKEKRFLFWTWVGESTKKYKFQMTKEIDKTDNSNLHSDPSSYVELLKQLKENFSNQTSFLSSEDYDFFRDKFPERFV